MLVAPPKPQGCVGQCTADPGSAPVDCDAEQAGLEFLPIWNFETQSGTGAPQVASNMYVYDDDSASFREPANGWQPPSDGGALAQRCGMTANHALHLYGGPYLGWGGGMGRRLAALGSSGCDPLESTCAPQGQEFPEHTIDLRSYEGISFWARRGPDGQAGIRVALGDKQTDDDINVVQFSENEVAKAAGLEPPHQLFCERAKECGCRSKPCTPYEPEDGGPTEYYCWDPAVDPIVFNTNNNTEPGDDVLDYKRCGTFECDHAYEGLNGTSYALPDGTPVLPNGMEPAAGEAIPNVHMDTQFLGKPCTEFAERGSVVSNFCYDPATDPIPAPGEQKCGDHWLSAVHLTTDWKFYKVPFTDLLQQGWAKEFHTLDLASASVVRFTFDRGWIDYWIDDVSFYRRAK